ncbi:sulfite exporter TauE/SafE family protein [Desulfosarcina ovata]|nr:sulfite exporter TauE/SafE family protein [Desulfosarcina ovata]
MMTTSLDLVALFMLGLFGTGHCIGMCGPLVVALPGQTGRFSAHLAYHAGRLMTYTIIGGLMGAAGGGLLRLAASVGASPMAWVGRGQVAVSLLAGVLLLFFGLSRLGLIAEPDWLRIATPTRMPGWRRLIAKAAHRRSNLDLLLMGLLLGGLPCGLSYAAFAKALAAARIFAGGSAGLVFGLGTLPGLLAVGAGAGLLLNRYRRPADLMAGVLMLGMAAALLVRVVAFMGA